MKKINSEKDISEKGSEKYKSEKGQFIKEQSEQI